MAEYHACVRKQDEDQSVPLLTESCMDASSFSLSFWNFLSLQRRTSPQVQQALAECQSVNEMPRAQHAQLLIELLVVNL